MQDNERWQKTLTIIKKQGKKKKLFHRLLAVGMTFIVLSLGITGYFKQKQFQAPKKQDIVLQKEAEFQVDLVLNQGIYYDQDLGIFY